MLKASKKKTKIRAAGARFAIVAAQYNPVYTDSLVRAIRRELHEAGCKAIELYRVPGSFEITTAAAALAARKQNPFAAIICVGVIMRGATTHADVIAHAAAYGITAIQVAEKVPVINGVYLFENEEQARQRCLDPKFNRGLELARTALQMAEVMEQIRQQRPSAFSKA